MIVMPANSTGWIWHCLARETGRIGHLFSPGAQIGPFPWFPYALDNGAFAAWSPKTNTWDESKWSFTAWQHLLFWAQTNEQKPLWAIVPDVPGNACATYQRWQEFAGIVKRSGFPLALAVQNGMTPNMVRQLSPEPDVICVGGTTEWKWATVEQWAAEFERVHVLRCNSPGKLEYLESLGIESCDGTGWNRGDRKQTQGLEDWARANAEPKTHYDITPHVCRRASKYQLTFA
jgi:hypothetical protein